MRAEQKLVKSGFRKIYHCDCTLYCTCGGSSNRFRGWWPPCGVFQRAYSQPEALKLRRRMIKLSQRSQPEERIMLFDATFNHRLC